MMWILVLYILYFFYKYAESVPKYSREVNETIFGKLSSMEDVLTAAKYTLMSNSPTTNDTDNSGFSDMNFNLDLEADFSEPDDFQASEIGHDFAAQQYNKLSNELKVMRRHFYYGNEFEDRDDRDRGYLRTERWKRHIFRKCFLQFILHTRHEVGKALRQREPLRTDKRYRLGYLFNRLRRIRTEQVKLLYFMINRQRHRLKPWGHWFRFYNLFFVADSFIHHLMIYERLAAFDVDLKDTIVYIKELYAKKEPYDYVEFEDSQTMVVTRFPSESPTVVPTPALNQEEEMDQANTFTFSVPPKWDK